MSHTAAFLLSCLIAYIDASQTPPCSTDQLMQAAFTLWQFMVQLAVRAPTSGSPASTAAKRSLFSGVVGPVLHILIHAPPAADVKQGGQTSSLWFQVLLFNFAVQA